MKIKITLKQGREYKPYSIGYCNAQYLLRYQTPFAYSAGIYGWSCDYYNVNGVIVCTGYRTVGNPISYDLVDKYERMARDVIHNPNITHKNTIIEVNNLLNELLTIRGTNIE